MDRLEAMRFFVAVVEAGSLAGAARALGRSPATVTRAVAQLEAQAGERLLERTTRRFAVTQAGERHADTYRLLLEELSRLDAPTRGRDVVGTVVVTAPELFGRLRVLPLAESFLAAHPGVQVRLVLLNRMVDLVGEGIDVAIRLAHLPDSSLTAVKVGVVRRLTCASPAYLALHPAPERPADLRDHSCIGLNEAGSHELWSYLERSDAQRVRSVQVTCRLALNHAQASIEAAERGLGLIRPLSYQVDDALTSGTLVTVLDAYEPNPIPVHFVFRSRPASNGAVRLFVDHAVPRLRGGLGDNRSSKGSTVFEPADR